jgi:hypothetical protein
VVLVIGIKYGEERRRVDEHRHSREESAR